jgi:hypothetical protein
MSGSVGPAADVKGLYGVSAISLTFPVILGRAIDSADASSILLITAAKRDPSLGDLKRGFLIKAKPHGVWILEVFLQPL